MTVCVCDLCVYCVYVQIKFWLIFDMVQRFKFLRNQMFVGRMNFVIQTTSADVVIISSVAASSSTVTSINELLLLSNLGLQT